MISFQTTMGRVANLTLRQMGSGQWDGVDISQGRLDLEDYALHSRLPHILWSADPPAAYVLSLNR